MAKNKIITDMAAKLLYTQTIARLDQVDRELATVESRRTVLLAQKAELQVIADEYVKTDYDTLFRPEVEEE